MGEHSLRSLARHVEDLARMGALLGPARESLLRDALRRALTGEPISKERLRVVLQPLDDGREAAGPGLPVATEPSAQALACLEALVETHRALLPPLLSAARRGDSRLLGLSREELVLLLPLWIDAARIAGEKDAQAFARLFTQLAGSQVLAGVSTLAAPLRRIFLVGSLAAAAEALSGLLHTSGIRQQDRRFFRRVDMHLAVGNLPEETLGRLGAWVLAQEELRSEILDRGCRGPLRVRLRATRLLGAAALGARELSPAQKKALAEPLRALLQDQESRIGHVAACGAAAMMPHPAFEDLWEPWFAGDEAPGWLPRVAAGVGVLVPRAPQRASELLSALLAGGQDQGAGAGRRPWLCGLARALPGLARNAPEQVEPVLSLLVAGGDPAALTMAAEELATLRLRHGALPVEEAWIRRCDQALGHPEGRIAEDWALVLAGREALVTARGGRPATSLTLLSRLLAREAIEGETPGRVMATAEELMTLAARRIRALCSPPASEEAVPLGAALHDLDDLLTCLVEEDLLGAVLLSEGTSRSEALAPLRERHRALQRELRSELHRISGDPQAPARWRAATLRRAARLAGAVPDDPLGRPSAPRTVGFVQLAGLPELLRAWRAGGEPAAAWGLGRVLDTLLPTSTPGSGDALLALLLAAPDEEAFRTLSQSLTEASAKDCLKALSSLAVGSREGEADARLTGVLQALEGLLSLPLERGVFAAPRAREVVEQAARHLRTAKGHERLISFMTPVRASLEQPAEPLLVALARDIAGLRLLAEEAGEAARRVALRALGEGDSLLARAAAQAVSRLALESASVEAEWVVNAEGVAEAVRRGASAAAGDREELAGALREAAVGLGAFANLVREAMPGLFGGLLAELLAQWGALVEARRERAMQAPAHPMLIDRFHIERLLGEGGMAFTYLAQDPALERPVTLKVMKPEIARRPDLRRLFSTEGKALAALPAHPHVVQVFEHLEAQDAPCLVMEYVDGQSLADLIPAHGMPVRRGLDLAVAAAQGLHHVHRHQLVHLDVKAENVMVGRDGTPKIIDFGLAQREHAVRQTRTVLGTPVYMSPEQARGMPLGASSDVYSFGVLLYEIFSGDVPFDAADPNEILRAHVTQAPPPLSSRRPELPDGLVLLVDDMLQKKPDDRPWMVEVASRLTRLRSALDPKEEPTAGLSLREIAVLCASLEGLAPETRDPSAVTSALELFLAATAEIVSGLGGRVDATVGERVFAVFGYPRDDSQAALHALRAAAQLRLRIERLGLPGITVLAGVAAGRALVGQVRGDPTDATVLGEPLWRAARLVEEAGPGAPLLVDEAAFELARGQLDDVKKLSRRDLGRYHAVTLRT